MLDPKKLKGRAQCAWCANTSFTKNTATPKPDRLCPECGKFPSNERPPCYHCFAVGNTIEECPEGLGKSWSEEFLSAKAEIDAKMEKDFPTWIQ